MAHPSPDAEVVHVHTRAGEQSGPYTRLIVASKLASGEFAQDDFFWYDGWEGWTMFQDHPDFIGDVIADSTLPPPEAPPPAPAPVPVVVAPTAVDPIAAEPVTVAEPVAIVETAPDAPAPVAAEPVQGTPSPDDAPTQKAFSIHPEVADDAKAAALAHVETAQNPLVHQVSPAEEQAFEDAFGALVQASWDWYDDHAFATHVDEVFLGAVITGTLDIGYALIDLTSDGTHHYLRFENTAGDRSRIVFRLTHLTSNYTTAKIHGHRASVVVGYGESLGNASKVLTAIRAEYQSAFIQDSEPGTITVDGDLASGYVYAQVDLTWTIDDYVDRHYNIDYPKISGHIAACTHTLRKYLRGRFA